jgi:hypothetical protein
MNINSEEHNRPIHDWSEEALDVQIRSEINAHTPPRPLLNISAEERDHLISVWSKEFDPAFDPHIRSAIIDLRLEEEEIARKRAIFAHTSPWPVMSEPTAPSAGLAVTRIAEYLNSDPNKTAIALKNLAAGGYVIRVSSDPDRWVRVVSVEVETIDGGVQPLANEAAQRSARTLP